MVEVPGVVIDGGYLHGIRFAWRGGERDFVVCRSILLMAIVTVVVSHNCLEVVVCDKRTRRDGWHFHSAPSSFNGSKMKSMQT